MAAAVIVAAGCSSPQAPPRDKAESVRRGDALAQDKKFAEAAGLYREALLTDEGDGDVHMKLAGAYQQAGKWPEAAEAAVRAADLMPEREDAQLLAGTLALSQGQFHHVIDRMATILRRSPDTAPALVLWASATARLSGSSWALYSLADAIGSPSQYEQALRTLRPGTTTVEDAKAEAALRQALMLTPNDLETRLALVNFLWATRRADEAEPMLRALADENPFHAAINQAMGQYYLGRNRAADGERYLQNAARAGEYGRAARFALVDHFIDSGRDGEARPLLESMLQADDATGDVSLRLASIETRAGAHDSALRRVEAVLAKDADNMDAQRARARSLVAAGRAAEAVTVVREIVAKSPESESARMALGETLIATGDLENAFDELQEAVRLRATSTQARSALTRVALSLRRNTEALFHARTLGEQVPSSHDAAVLRARALAAGPASVTTEREINELLARFPDSPDLIAQLAAAQAANGNDAAARATYGRALKLQPQSFDAVSGLVALDLRQRDPAAARRRADAAAGAHQGDTRFLLLAARTYAAQGDEALAERTLRTVLEREAGNAEAAVLLSDTLARAKRLDEAIRILEATLTRRPRSVDALTALAKLLVDKGRRLEAAEIRRKAGEEARR